VGGADALTLSVPLGGELLELLFVFLAFGVGYQAGIDPDRGVIVGEVVDAVEVEVLEQVLNAPAGPGPRRCFVLSGYAVNGRS
jgi:hypothetical protein